MTSPLTAEDLTAAAAALAAQAGVIRREIEYSSEYGKHDAMKREARAIELRAGKFRTAALAAATDQPESS